MTGPALEYTNEQARNLERDVARFTALVNRDIYNLLKWAESLREALQVIADTDPVDAALDPSRSVRIAEEALNPTRRAA